MRKLLSKPAGSPHDPPSSIDLAGSPFPLLYRPSGPQDGVYQAGHPISALDKSPDGRGAVLGGRHVLKTVRLDGTDISEVYDLRALITATQPYRSTSSSTSTADQLAIRDVKWASGHGDTTIFTACMNGNIFQYDLGHIGARATPGGIVGVEVVQTREDSRQINTLDINPHRSSYLLSGDQGGIVRCFDIRGPVPSRTGLSFRSLQAFRCNADSVRHVKWSPKEGFFFACATEQGVVLKWDIRKATAPLLRINAHDKACTSISWHPDAKHLVSGGSDKKCHVWDMSKNADKRQKPKYTISTPAYVSSVSWRPGQWSATCQGLRAAQIAVAYDTTAPKRMGNNAVHIWDLARPTIPYKAIERFEHSPAALLWKNQEFLWTAGPDGLFTQCDVAFAPQVIDRTSVSALTFSSSGDVLAFLDERPPCIRPRLTTAHPAEMAHRQTSPAAPTIPSSYGSDPTTPALSVSRSDSEDEAVRSFLIPRRRTRRKRRASSIQALGSTPPSGQQTLENATLSLEQAISTIGPYRPQQIMAIGHVAAAARKDIYGYLAANYLDALERELPEKPGNPVALPERVVAILDSYAQAAEDVQQFRLAQVWRILAFAMDLLLKRRGQYHLEQRMHPPERILGNVLESGSMSPQTRKTLHVRSLLTEEIESTSNVPTPIVRPVVMSGALSSDDGNSQHGGSLHRERGLSLGPAAYRSESVVSKQPRRHLDSLPLSEASQDSESTKLSSIEGYDFYDTEALARVIDVPRTGGGRRQSSVLSFIGSENSATREPVRRQDSDEMFRISQLSQGSGGAARHGQDQQQSTYQQPYQTTTQARDIADKRSCARAVPKSSRLAHLSNALLSMEWGNNSGTADDGAGTTQGGTISGVPSSQATPLVGSLAHSDTKSLFGTTVPYPQVDSRQDDGGTQNGTPEQRDNPDHVTEHDYLPWPGDPPFPFPLKTDSKDGATRADGDACRGLDPYMIVKRALSFEVGTSPLNASSMVLLLKPLVPDDTIDPLLASSILRQHHGRLMSMKLFLEAALLRKVCVKGWPGGELAQWGDSYKAVTAPAQHNVAVSYICTRCHKPREIEGGGSLGIGNGVWVCERCRAVMGACAVCGHRDASALPGSGDPEQQASARPGGDAAGRHPDSEDSSSPPLSTWWYCAECGHGGHSTCLEAWHSIEDTPKHEHAGNGDTVAEEDSGLSGGCCPLDGCGHACLPGRWRSEMIAARSEAVSSVVREASRALARTSVSSMVSNSSPGGGGGGGGGGRDRHYGSVDSGSTGPGSFGPGGFGGHSVAGGSVPGSFTGNSFAIREDKNEVGQSAAVDMVRESLGVSRDEGPLRRVQHPSPAQSVAGDATRERERRKSVKFAGTRQ